MCVRTSIAWHCAVARGMSSSSGSLECELPFHVFPDNKVKSKNKWGEMLRDVTFFCLFTVTTVTRQKLSTESGQSAI